MYQFGTTYLTEKLTPSVLRNPKILAYLRVLSAPLEVKWNDFLEYIDGSNYIVWDITTAYSLGDKVKYGYAIYEAIQANISEIPYNNTTNWLLINKDFVGLNARARFNGGKMLFEYVLNLYLNTTPTTAPLIYTTRNAIDVSGFFMGTDGASELGELGIELNQDDFLGITESIIQNAMTIYVPLALYTSLASNAADREARVRNIADRYVVAGIKYNVLTY